MGEKVENRYYRSFGIHHTNTFHESVQLLGGNVGRVHGDSLE
jgi:hypothetical protein